MMSHLIPQSLEWAFLENEQLKERLKKSEAENYELRLSDAQYHDILRNMSEAVELDDPNYNITYVNKAFCDFYGVTEEEVLGTNSMDWVIPEDRKRIDKQMDRVTPEKPDYRYTCRVKTTKGEMFWIEVLGHCFFDKKGNVLVYQDISRNITQYKEAAKQAERFRLDMEEKVRLRTLELTQSNQELSEINSYLQSTLNNISEGVILVKNDGDSVFLNYGSNTEWNHFETFIRNGIKEAVLNDKLSAIYQLVHNKEDFKNTEITFTTPNGDIQFLVSGAHIINPDNESQGILVFRPLAEVRRLVNKFSGAQARFNFEDIIGESQIIKDTIHFAKKIASSDGNVVIEGESGTGKELFAQSIHNESSRKNGPFIAVNCGAIPRDLIASELFGYADGSFTGAKRGGKTGKFEMATGGTIFLDECGDMPLEQQISLLRVIQERAITRIGGSKVIPVDVRIICATNKELIKEVEKGNFRQDLYYRLNVINIHIPPLRERKEDIFILFENFFKRQSKTFAASKISMDDGFSKILMAYNWPGNVRELQNVTDRTFFIANQFPLTAKDLPEYILQSFQKEKQPVLPELDTNLYSITEVRKQERIEKDHKEKELIMQLLENFNGNASRVAKEMGISRAALYQKFNKYRVKR